MGNLAAAVAHEVRNPLNAISMGLQRLKLEFQPTDDQRRLLVPTELMLGETQPPQLRSSSNFSRWRARSRSKPKRCRCAEVLKELAALQESDAKRSNVRIRVIAAPNLPPLTADPSHLTQVLLNLMLNGLQAMPNGGTLTLEAKTSNGNFLIAVTDTGTGIAPENPAANV